MTNLARGLVANSQQNWAMLAMELAASFGVLIGLAVESLFQPTAPLTPETESSDSLLQRFENRVRQETADKIMKGLK